MTEDATPVTEVDALGQTAIHSTTASEDVETQVVAIE